MDITPSEVKNWTKWFFIWFLFALVNVVFTWIISFFVLGRFLGQFITQENELVIIWAPFILVYIINFILAIKYRSHVLKIVVVGLCIVAASFLILYFGTYGFCIVVMCFFIWKTYPKLQSQPNAPNAKPKTFFKWLIFTLVNLVASFFFAIFLMSLGQKKTACVSSDTSFPYLLFLLAAVFFSCSLFFAIKYKQYLSKILRAYLVIIFIVVPISIFFTSLDSSRRKGCDATLKSAMANSRAQAEIYYDKHKTYAGVCTANDGVLELITNAAQLISQKNKPTSGSFLYSSKGAPNSTVCHDRTDGWAAITSLKNPFSPGGGWCVDYKGSSKEASMLLEGEITCEIK